MFITLVVEGNRSNWKGYRQYNKNIRPYRLKNRTNPTNNRPYARMNRPQLDVRNFPTFTLALRNSEWYNRLLFKIFPYDIRKRQDKF